MQPVVRVSILRCAPERFAELRQMMIAADAVLRPGIEAMAGLIAYYAGADDATSSLTNVSVWTDLGKEFAAKGATFERPIMNYATLWQLRGIAASETA